MSAFSNKRRRALNISETWEVESNDDLLMVVLVRLPPKSIFRFQCVSKRWKYVISAPFFHQNYYSLRKERALAYKMVASIQEIYSEANSENFYRHDSTSSNIKPVSGGPKLVAALKFREDVHFVNSSNGLILSQRKKCTEYVIVNPVTRRATNLIRPELPKFCDSPPASALVCEENTKDLVLNYKVVVAGKKKEENSYLTINTFCSKTGKWMTSTPSITGNLNDKLSRHSSSPFVVDNIIHWFTRGRLYLVVYYLDSNTIQLLELPAKCRNNYSSKVMRSSHGDNLWLCTHMPERCCIKFWMVPTEKYDSYRLRSSTIPRSAWILMREYIYPAPIPARGLDSKEEIANMKFAYGHWWRGNVPRKEPFMRFFIVNYRNRHNFNPCEYSPYMEALTLSSYSLLNRSLRPSRA